MTAPLFTPFDLGPVRLSNRIVVSPMCQYSANDGSMNDWHLQHLMTMAMSGAGLVVVEATAVERIGRITHGCTGLYSDDNERAMARTVAAARGVALPGVKFGVQIGHAGRKASAERPWEGGRTLKDGDDPWTTVAPSPIPFDDGWPAPAELTDADLTRIETAFVQAAKRAVRIGFEAIELHMAHGYRVARAVRAVVPADVALGARITGSDWTEEGLKPEDAVATAKALKEIGLDFVCVSSGGVALKARIAVGPGYQVPFAAKVRREAGIATRAVGMIVDPRQANDIVTRGDADMVALARALLDDPRWGWHAAEALGAEIARPPQYARVAPAVWPGAALVRPREDDEFRRSA